MKILWVINFVLPETAHLLKSQKIVFGGWISSMLKPLAKAQNIQLGVAMKAPVDKVITAYIDNIQYYLVPQDKKNHFDIPTTHCHFVLNDFSPDILHIEGSEFPYATRFLKLWPGHQVVSMQGILNGYSPYEYGHLEINNLLFSWHPLKILVAITMILNKQLFFKPRLAKERETIQLAKNILGRTHWDKAHAYAINPNAIYHHCNRILRDDFYQHTWNIDNITRHTLFIGNAGKPLKGTHFMLHAIALLKQEYPNIKLFIAGESIHYNSWKQWKKIVGYSAYLRHLIKTLDIADHVEFTGILHANEMVNLQLKTHIYVMTSVIENSPNTLGEAMILGVPCIASFAGGASDMAQNEKDALFYRDDDPIVLAHQIKRIFDNDQLALKLSTHARATALITHSPQTNVKQLLTAYQQILTE